ncbi:hypothetical protein, partial [Escherichia coli]|uniref:hypothetical protein n=1 Tax=Escherichia coli TaxID=562 RepID=UPI001BB47C8F
MVTLKAHILPHHDLQPPGCRGSYVRQNCGLSGRGSDTVSCIWTSMFERHKAEASCLDRFGAER